MDYRIFFLKMVHGPKKFENRSIELIFLWAKTLREIERWQSHKVQCFLKKLNRTTPYSRDFVSNTRAKFVMECSKSELFWQTKCNCTPFDDLFACYRVSTSRSSGLHCFLCCFFFSVKENVFKSGAYNYSHRGTRQGPW